MSNANQGFVQAFSRRRSGGRFDPSCQIEELPRAVASKDTEEVSQAKASSNISGQSESFGLEFDESTAGSASLWIDQADEGVLRIDPSHDRGDHDYANADTVASRSTVNDLNTNTAEDAIESAGKSSVNGSIQHTLTAYGEGSLQPDATDAAVSSEQEKEDETSANSMLVKERTVAKSSFQPAWEVDGFQIPEAIKDLFVSDGLLGELSQRLLEAVSDGLASIAVTSVKSGEGKTSVAIGLALSAAAADLKVALIDADLFCPSVIDQLQMDVEHGWNEKSDAMPLAEVAVYSHHDQFTIFPLKDHLSPSQSVDVLLEDVLLELQEHFDLIVIDAGCQRSFMQPRVLHRVNSSVIVQDISQTEQCEVASYADVINEAGIRSVGVVRNHAA